MASLLARSEGLEKACGQLADVVVVGGGITGAGVAREAALRGYGVVLLDKSDFASGTSSRSSKLIHGGVRYLAQGDVALVREAARERAVLRRLAPHLAQPVRMVIPAGSRATRMKLAAGLWTFDKLAGDVDDRHKVLDREQTLTAVPGLRSERLNGAVAFTEFTTNDARLTLETLLAAAAKGAVVVNYAVVRAVQHDPDGVRVAFDDLVSGASGEIRARCLVNAAGPWFDRVQRLCDAEAPTSVQLTRGIHLVVPRTRLPVDSSVVLRSPDNRSTFVVPRDEFVYIGTTDTHYSGAAEEPGLSRDDVDYLLASLAATFEDAPGADDVIGAWSGVRPLLCQAGRAPSEISRKDEIRVGPGPVVAIAGGKLTTFRRMAERVVDRAQAFLPAPPLQDVRSDVTALVGGSLEDQRRARREAPSLKDTALEERLWSTYGAVAAQLVQRIDRDASLAERLAGLDGLTAAEVEHAVENEMVVHLDDVLRRRSSIAVFDTKAATDAARAVAERLAMLLGWDERRIAKETDAFVEDRLAELRVARGVYEQGPRAS